MKTSKKYPENGGKTIVNVAAHFVFEKSQRVDTLNVPKLKFAMLRFIASIITNV